ncbi:MAG: hypothetical protein VXZ39_05365, partial [Planctomycetota bacterium]|nr:hypothetical protein [Planctomycetota bacterium]
NEGSAGSAAGLEVPVRTRYEGPGGEVDAFARTDVERCDAEDGPLAGRGYVHAGNGHQQGW